MKAFMAAVLLRLAGLDALMPDAEADPPHGQPAQPGRRGRGERRAIIGADRQRQTMFAEGGFHHRAHTRRIGFIHRHATDQIARAGVGDGEWIDARAVGGAVACDNGCDMGGVRRRLRRRWDKPSSRSQSPMVLAAGHCCSGRRVSK